MNDANEVRIHFLDYWRIIKVRAGLIALVFLLVIITAVVTTFFLPREYYSKVTLEVKPDKAGAIDVFGSSSRAGLDPFFVSTQFQILQKTEILHEVIKSQNLVQAWKIEGTPLPLSDNVFKLRKMMDLREVRNTGLIDIGIYSTNAQEAADIANSIADVYREKRLSDLQKNIDRGLAQLREEVYEKQRKRMDDAGREMARIRERDAINDSDPENLSSVLSTSDRSIVMLEQQANEQQLTTTKLRGQLEQVVKFKPSEMKEAARTLNIDDPNVVRMAASLQDATSEEARLTSNGLGENHPRILAVRSMHEVFASQLAESLETIRQSLGNRLAIEEQTLKSIQAKFEEAKHFQIGDKQKMVAYADAKSQYLQSKKIFEAAQLKYATELLERGIDFEPAKIWDRAEKALRPSRPNVTAFIALAIFAGIGMGVGLAFFIEYLDTSVKSLDDVEKYLKLPVLAVVNKGVPDLIKLTGDCPEAEAYRILRANLEFNRPDRNANTLTLVSGGPGEGKSTTLNNLAVTCAAGGYNVLVVDADLRRPTQHLFFDAQIQPGLVEYLTGNVPMDEIIRTTRIPNLSFISSGQVSGEAVGVLNSQRMVDLIAILKTRYDLVLFDAPPILGISDGSVLASECEMTIMVVQHRRFPRAMLQRVKQAVDHSGGKLIGIVLNNVDSKHDEGYSYANGYNDYYATAAKPGERPTSPAPLLSARPRTDLEDY